MTRNSKAEYPALTAAHTYTRTHTYTEITHNMIKKLKKHFRKEEKSTSLKEQSF